MEDFESQPEFQALAVAAAGKPERSMGDSVIPAEPPQWKEVRAMARDLAKAASNQLALHVYLIQAETHVGGFAGFEQSLSAVCDLFSEQWDSMYPEPDLDDPDDMYYARVNLMNELSEQPVFLDAVHKLPLVSARGIGEFSCRDIEISAGVVAGSEEDQARCQEGLIRGAFAESDPDALRAQSDALARLPEFCNQIEALFVEKTGQHGVLSLDRLRGRLEACRTRFNEYAQDHLSSSDVEEQSNDVADTTTAEVADADKSRPAKASSLADQHMVLSSFDAILGYYETYEPSSPVRVLTFRARSFVNQSFFEILQTLAPDHRDNLPAMLAALQKQPLASLLSDSYARFLNGEAVPSVTESSDMEPGSGNSHAPVVIGSRDEVLEVLQDIETYFITKEPASPIPLIIADIRKLVSKRFVELMAEFSRLLPQTAGESEEGS